MTSKLDITATTHELPFDKLSPREFERLCLWLVEREGFDNPKHLGAAGGEQGRDIVAWKHAKQWTFQCKRTKRFGPRSALAELEKVLALPDEDRPHGHVFIIACDVSARTRKTANALCAGQIECDFWAGTELDLKVKRQPSILREFFHIAKARADHLTTLHSPLTLEPALSLHRLPPETVHFVKRPDYEGKVRLLLKRAPKAPRSAVVICALSGRAGVGKSTLAAHVALSLRRRFHDGVLYVDLRGTAGEPKNPADVLGRFLHDLGVRHEDIPDSLQRRTSLYRKFIAGRSVLLVLDNARDEEQVRPLLPDSPSCAVIITSRRQLAAIDMAGTVDLGVMTRQQARALLSTIAGGERVKGESEAAEEIIRLCEYLPLAVRIAGGMLSLRLHWSLTHYARLLRDERRRLDLLDLGDMAIRSSIQISYNELIQCAPLDARLFRLLGDLIGSDFEPGVAGALANMNRDTAEGAIERLVDAQLLEPSGGRYRLHDLVRLFARERLEEEVPAKQRQAARTRFAQYCRIALRADSPRSFFDKAQLMDELLKWDAGTIDAAALGEFYAALKADPSMERYFFKHLAMADNATWLRPLRDLGAFSSPPPAITIAGRTSHPWWPPLWYLHSLAVQESQAILKLVEATTTDNVTVLHWFILTALSMPPAQAAAMVPCVEQWMAQGVDICSEAIELVAYLAEGVEWEPALRVESLILSPQEDTVADDARHSPSLYRQATWKAEDYEVRLLLEKSLPLFLSSRPREFLEIVQDSLECAVRIETRGSGDLSDRWRPAIEPHEQNTGFGGVKELLVEAAVKTLEVLVARYPDDCRSVVEEYLAHRYPVFRRIGIHMVRVNSSVWPDLLEALFVNRRSLDDVHVHHEYWTLTHEAYPALSPEARERFVDWLLCELPSDGVETPSEGRWHPFRVFRWLWAVKDHLPARATDTFQQLFDHFGTPEYPDLLTWSSGLLGTVSPLDQQELLGMSPQEILGYLKRQDLPVKDLGQPSVEGLANVLKTAITARPKHFTAITPDLKADDIKPIYAQYAIWGFREAWKENRPFDWDPVLILCEQILLTVDEPEDDASAADMQPGYWQTTYASARIEALRLLEGVLTRADNAIPAEYLPRVRDILLASLDDVNPSREYEHTRMAEYQSSPLDLALNTNRPIAVAALVQYALHLARLRDGGQQLSDLDLALQSRLGVAVRHKLTDKLDTQAEPSLAVRSVLGRYLPNLHYLDAGWTVEHLEDIFPRRPEMAEYREAAWDGYMFRSEFYIDVYQMLRPYYRHAIEQFASREQGAPGSDLSSRRLANHLALAYWFGREPLGGENSLLGEFFESVPDDIRAALVTNIGTGLREVQPAGDSEQWQRANALWRTRHRVIVEALPPGILLPDTAKELGAFTDWVLHIPEDLRHFYDLIWDSARASGNSAAYRLLEFLASVVDKHAAFAVRLFEALVGQDRGTWFFPPSQPTGRTILEAAMHSGDEEARATAVRVINWFGRNGNEAYRHLLKL